MTVAVNDGRGGITTQTFTVNLQVLPPSRPPIITSTPVVDVSSSGNPIFTRFRPPIPMAIRSAIAWSSGPIGLTIDPSFGVVSWTPTAAQIGTSAVTLVVSDKNGETAQSFNIAVLPKSALTNASNNGAPIFLQPTLLDFTPLSFTPTGNIAIDTPGVGYLIHPGVNILGNIPFTIPQGTLNTWNAYYATGPNPRVLDIYTAIPNATELDTLINTFAGSVGPDAYAFIEFFGSDGAYYEKPLVGNIDIRDYNPNIYANLD